MRHFIAVYSGTAVEEIDLYVNQTMDYIMDRIR
jgi:hypothetical protein